MPRDPAPSTRFLRIAPRTARLGLLAGATAGCAHADLAPVPDFGPRDGAHDMVVAVDVSGSMIEEMNAVVAGLHAALDILSSGPSPDDHAGLVTFTGGAEVYAPLLGFSSPAETAEIYADWIGDGRSNFDAEKTSGLTNCYGTMCYTSQEACGELYLKVLPGDWMLSCEAVGFDGTTGYSSPGDAVAASLELLSNSEADSRDIVLITDGRPTFPGYSDSEHNPGADARADFLVEQVDGAANEGISVWIVGVNTPPSPEQDAFLEVLPRGHGFYWSTSDETSVVEALSAIVGTVD